MLPAIVNRFLPTKVSQMGSWWSSRLFRVLVMLGSCALLVRAPGLALPAEPVSLVVPVETGSELEELQALYPRLQLLEVDGQTMLLLGRFGDARHAYAAGRVMQDRMSLPFELLYPPAHPQADGRWLASLPVSGPQASRPAPLARSESNPMAGLPEAFEASELGGALALMDGGHDASVSQLPAMPQATLPSLPPLPPLPPLESRPAQGRGPLAANPHLRYLLVPLESEAQARDLAGLVGPAAHVSEVGGVFLAQVGVFAPSRVGDKLLRQRQQWLANSGYQVQILEPSL